MNRYRRKEYNCEKRFKYNNIIQAKQNMCFAVYMDVFKLPMEVNIPIPTSYIYRISSIYPMRIILL